MAESILFDVVTPLGFRVRTTVGYWRLITRVKHPVMHGRRDHVMKTLCDPDRIRQSRSDPAVFLFYRLERPGRWLCAVAKRLNGEGFLITAYPTDTIKEGERLWAK